MAEWFFRKKGRNEVERDPGWAKVLSDAAYENKLGVAASCCAFVKGCNLSQMANEWEVNLI